MLLFRPTTARTAFLCTARPWQTHLSTYSSHCSSLLTARPAQSHHSHSFLVSSRASFFSPREQPKQKQFSGHLLSTTTAASVSNFIVFFRSNRTDDDPSRAVQCVAANSPPSQHRPFFQHDNLHRPLPSSLQSPPRAIRLRALSAFTLFKSTIDISPYNLGQACP